MINGQFIQPFLDATLNVLKIQAGISAVAGDVKVRASGELPRGDVTGYIGIVSEEFNGSVAICFPEGTFLNVMSAMLGEQYTELNQEILDGVGELTNMIFGMAKVSLNEKGYGIKMALPQVISGKNHMVVSLGRGETITIPFESSAGEFRLEMSLSE